MKNFKKQHRMDEQTNMNNVMGKKNKKWRGFGKILPLVCFFAVLAGVLTGCYQQKNEKKSALETIKVGIDKFEPYSYQDIDGNYAGIDVELATLAFEKFGYKPEFQIISWEDKDEYLADGSIDCIWSCYTMTDREKKYQWSGPYMYSRQAVVVRSDSDIYTLADLKNKRVGVQATTKAENLFLHMIDSKLPDVRQVNSFSTTEELFAVLRKGYVDAIAGHEALIGRLTSDDSNTYRMLEESPYISELGVAFAKGTHKELSDKLTKILEKMKKDGTIDKIVQKYGLDPEKNVWGGQADEK